MTRLKKITAITLSVVLIYFVYNIILNNFNKNEPEVSKNDTKFENQANETKTSEPIFISSPIPEEIKNKMLGKSMPYNEPISFDSLEYLKVTYFGFDKKSHVGELVVDKNVSSDLLEIFRELYENKYPIEKIKLIDEYNAVDEDSMADNNSSAFCYRTIAGTNKISNHGKGRAVDINPLQNPHVVGNTVNPTEGSIYANRNLNESGMVIEGDACYNAFIKRGWSWGGHWKNPDYQHFEK